LPRNDAKINSILAFFLQKNSPDRFGWTASAQLLASETCVTLPQTGFSSAPRHSAWSLDVLAVASQYMLPVGKAGHNALDNPDNQSARETISQLLI